jgi:hypothetical protein
MGDDRSSSVLLSNPALFCLNSKKAPAEASAYPLSNSGSLAMLLAIRRASSIVSTLAVSVCAFVSRA